MGISYLLTGRRRGTFRGIAGTLPVSAFSHTVQERSSISRQSAVNHLCHCRRLAGLGFCPSFTAPIIHRSAFCGMLEKIAFPRSEPSSGDFFEGEGLCFILPDTARVVRWGDGLTGGAPFSQPGKAGRCSAAEAMPVPAGRSFPTGGSPAAGHGAAGGAAPEGKLPPAPAAPPAK